MKLTVPTWPQSPPPDMLRRAALWLYLLDLGITKAGILAAFDSMVAAGTLTAGQADRLRIKVEDSLEFERTDPDMLLMAQLLGIASDQAALDAHFRAADGITNQPIVAS